MLVSLDRRISPGKRELQVRTKIVFVATAWWLFLALLSRLDLSPLQQIWTTEGEVAIFLYLPVCILAGGAVAVALSKPIYLDARGGSASFKFTKKIFYTFIIIFAAQCFVFVPPFFSGNPNDARLDWGIPYIHVLTEIIIRVMCLIVVGNACVRRRLLPRDRYIFIVSIVYTVLVVSRSFMLEVIFYWGFASLVSSAGLGGNRNRIYKSLFVVALVVGIFIGYGNWRQGSDFSIVEYGEMTVDSNALAWIFGYFLVNYDNLALLIGEQYKNTAFSNSFGSLLQTLQVAKFEQVNDYLYVGKFNLGTAFRPFVLDFGVWIGGMVFVVLWALILLSPSYCRHSGSRYALHALIAYSAFCLPITSRIEQPPYLFALIWILVADRGNIININQSKRSSIRFDEKL